MGKFSLADILNKIVIPLAVYLSVGLLVLELAGFTKMNQFLMWSIMAGVIFAVKDILQNKIVTLGIGVYTLLAVLWLFLGMKEQASSQALMMLIGIAAIMLLRFLRRYPIIYILLGYGMALTLVILTINQYEFSKLVTAFTIFVCLNSFSETIALYEKVNNSSLAVLYIIAAGITFFAPISEKAYDWKFVENIASSVNDLFKEISQELTYQWGSSNNSGIFRVNFSGYSDEENSIKFGLKDSEIEQLSLEGERTRRNLYLKGNTTNYFDGDAWSCTLRDTTMDVSVDTLMTLYAIFSYYQDEDEIKRFLDIYEYKLALKNLKTSSIFYPLKTLDISSENVILDGDNLRSTKVNKRGYSYQVAFMDLDYANTALVNIIQNSHSLEYDKEIYDKIYELLAEYFDVKIDKIPFQTFIEKVSLGADAIRRYYAVPDECVSEPVRGLALQIIEEYDDDYQKCKALQHFLAQYTYNKNILIPQNSNVLDWFLFDGMEGYCTHFATALVEMLRCAGIPARMVEGFLVDYDIEEGPDNYIITAQKAHAWAEAYIEGFGWIRLDVAASDNGDSEAWYQEESDESGMDSIYADNDLWNQILQEQQAEIIRKEEELWQAEELRKKEEKDNWILAMLLMGGMAGVIFIVCVALFIYQKVMIQRSKNPNVIFEDMMKLFKKKYRAKFESETLKEYLKNIAKENAIEADTLEKFEQLTNILEGYWYGGAEPNDTAVEYMKKFRDELKMCDSD